MATWTCQLCSAHYICLRDLVSHVRASHSGDENLNFVCEVSQCVKVFRNTNTWYRHVVKNHSCEYHNDIDQKSDQEHDSMDDDDSSIDDNMDDDDFLDDLNLPSEVQEDISLRHEIPPFMSKEEVVGKLLMLKEKYLVSQAAIAEVVDLVQMVCDQTAAHALSRIILTGEACDLDTSTDFFQQLPGILDSLSSPLAAVRSTYRQHSYIVQNLPYVVSGLHVDIATLLYELIKGTCLA